MITNLTKFTSYSVFKFVLFCVFKQMLYHQILPATPQGKCYLHVNTIYNFFK